MSHADLSRAQFISTGARGGLALVAGGSLLALADTAAGATAAGDVAIAKLAATAELLAIDFYTRCVRSGAFRRDQLAYMQAALKNEKDHYAALAGLLGRQAPKGVRFRYPAGAFASARSAATLGAALETAFVGAYMGAVKALKSNDLKATAALVGANEAQHLTNLNHIAKGVFVANPALPKVLTAAQATAAVKGFIIG